MKNSFISKKLHLFVGKKCMLLHLFVGKKCKKLHFYPMNERVFIIRSLCLTVEGNLGWHVLRGEFVNWAQMLNFAVG